MGAFVSKCANNISTCPRKRSKVFIEVDGLTVHS